MKDINYHHPSYDIVNTCGNELENKKIILCICGSVAAYKSIELARLLMRHGANVVCVMSKSATKLLSPDYLKWATGNVPVTKLTGELEHIKLADYSKSDLIIVYPTTANIIGKLANGISDSILSTILMVGLGSNTPIFMALAMHESMYNNIAVIKNINLLNKKINILSPRINEDKAKIIEPEEMTKYVIDKTQQKSALKNKCFLITAGSTIEYIDPIKIITNNSTGKTGILLAKELAEQNANVTLICGHTQIEPPDNVNVIQVDTSDEMFKEIKKKMKNRIDVVILSAAVSDYKPNNIIKHKIKSDKLTLKLKKNIKIIDQIKKIQNDVFLVGFKAESCVSKTTLIKKARQKMLESDSNMIVANDIGRMMVGNNNSDYNDVVIISNNSIITTGLTTKTNIAKTIIRTIIKNISN
ncbi:MAG: bifunctional phosphopantothenoylcysteine decarboxylase/phosphopantothenate--cysteine ligase CoaBC [Thaumarchaeota archaeon]|nr:bifunctional phosphopantothenoylcysteine decarboxylase/phosphopantothenate--cysteine ligase CoaBC [Nitrososphaerota archaeon]